MGRRRTRYQLQMLRDSREQEELTISAEADSDAHINVFYLGGSSVLLGGRYNDLFIGLPAYGAARPEQNIVFIDSALFGLVPPQHREEMRLHIFGPGHPDQGGGPAPLPGLQPADRVKDRVMVSGPMTRLPGAGLQIVKGEWDAAEAWFREQEQNNKPF